MISSRRTGLENKHIHLCHVRCRKLSAQEFQGKSSELCSEFPLYPFNCPPLFEGLQLAYGLLLIWLSKICVGLISVFFFCVCAILNSFWQTEEMPRVPRAGFMWVYINTLGTGSFKLFKRPFPGFLTILTL